MPPPNFVALNPYRSLTGFALASDGPGNADAAIYVPCTFPDACTLTAVKVCFTNGGNNYDLGLYDSTYARVASKGNTATSAGIHSLALSNIAVTAGAMYYVGFVVDNVGVRYLGATLTSAILVAQAGCTEQASARPLPATATPAVPSSWIHLPVIVFSCL